MFERLRHQYGFGADAPDSTVLRHVRNLKFPEGVDDDTFADGVADFENEAAPADSTPRRHGETSPAGAAIPQAIGGLAKAGFSEIGQAGKAFLNAPVQMAKDLANIPRGLIADPLAQVFQNRKATPEEEGRSQSGLAGLVGLAVPGPVGKLAAKAKLPARLAGAVSWGAGGAADAAIRSGGDRHQIAGGAGLAALMGALTHGKAPVGDTAAKPFATPEPDPVWHAGLESDQPTYAKVGGGPSPASKARATRQGHANALEGLYGAESRTVPTEPGELYHGSGTRGLSPANLDATSTKPEGLFGQGVYLTDNPDVAGGYARARARRTGTPTVYRARVGEHKTLDLEAPAPAEATQAYAKVAKGWPFSEHGSPEFDATVSKPGATGQDLHSALARDATNISHDEGIPSGEFHDVFGNLSDNLRQAGYESLSHTGGLRVGGYGEHRVTILLDPNDAGGLGRKPPIQSFADLGPVPRGRGPETTPSPKIPFMQQRALQGLYGRKPPRVPRSPIADMLSGQPEDLPMNPKSQVARSGIGPLVSSVTDRLRAMGGHGKAIDDMIENVVRQSQETPGDALQPFDQAVHAVAGKKGRLTVDARSQILGALERGTDPKKLPPELLPLYEQQKAYFDATVQRGTALGSTVKRGEERIPIAKAAIKNFFPHSQIPTVKEITSDLDLRSSMERNLIDKGLATSPEEAAAILKDHVAFVQSKGRNGGQLAIRATLGLNPNYTAAEVRQIMLRGKPPIREVAGSLEHAREINSPFYDPRPEVVFPKHVVENERALAEIQHYGQDASKLTGKIRELPSDMQREAQHLVRTATESHPSWDPRVEGFLAKLRSAQLGLFTPVTTVKNLSQRENNMLTSDMGSFLKKGMIATKGAAKIGARSGARAEGAHETLAQALGTGQEGFGPRWLRAIGFTQAERGNRNTGAAAGLDEASKYAGRLGKNPNDKLASYRLSRAGINPGEVKGGVLSQAQENRAGLARSNRAQFRSHPKDLPDWFTSNPVTRTAALFKGFDYQQTRLMLDETLGRLASGQPGDRARGLRNIAIAGTVYPLIGEGVNDVYGIISRKESPKHVVVRTKEFIHDTAMVASGKMNPVDYAGKYKARYGADLLAGAAPGAGGVLATTLQYGKGDKGGGIVRQAVGPAISRPAEAVQLAHDALTQKDKKGADKPMTPAQKREALRLLLGGSGSMAGPWMYPDKNAAGQKDNQ